MALISSRCSGAPNWRVKLKHKQYKDYYNYHIIMSTNIDKIIYINLDKRKDRFAEIEKEFLDMNIPCERFTGIEHPASGLVGCGLSHLAVLKLAKERNYKNVLIVEDDFTFKVEKDFFEEQLSLFFDTRIEYDVLMLAYSMSSEHSCDIPNITSFKRLTYAHTATCYLVNNHYYDKLINLYEWSTAQLIQTGQHWNYANDQVWRRLQESDMWIYSTTKMGVQRPGFSDNTLRMHDNYDT
jgi:glycosyl transferase family 25